MKTEVRLKVWGRYALFTSPECKVERYSYPIMTPTAAKGILQSILSHTQLYYVIKEIHLLKPVRMLNIKTNELKDKNGRSPGDESALRSNYKLYDVAYVIVADMCLDPFKQRPEENILKYERMFNQRAVKMQSYSAPYLGTRECGCYYDLATENDVPLPITEDLGYMLYDWTSHKTPLFFKAQLDNGIMRVEVN